MMRQEGPFVPRVEQGLYADRRTGACCRLGSRAIGGFGRRQSRNLDPEWRIRARSWGHKELGVRLMRSRLWTTRRMGVSILEVQLRFGKMTLCFVNRFLAHILGLYISKGLVLERTWFNRFLRCLTIRD